MKIKLISAILMASASVAFAKSVEPKKAAKTPVEVKAPVSQAKSPELKISGYSIVQWSAVGQKHKGDSNGQSNQIGIGASDLYFTATGTTESGINYKWRGNITMISTKNPTIDRNYIEFSHNNWGTLQVGSLTGTEDTMPYSGFDLLGGGNTIDGALGGFYNFSSGVISGVNVFGKTKRANKIVYTTPRLNGFQAGITYTPNTSLRGDSGPNGQNPNASSSNVGRGAGNESAIYGDKATAAFGLRNIAMGLSYKNTWDDFSLSLASVMMIEKSRLTVENATGFTNGDVPVNHLKVFNHSIVLGYKNMRLGAGFIDNGDSRLPKQQIDIGGTSPSTNIFHSAHLGNAGKAWNVAAQYTKGAYQFAVGYYNTRRRTDASHYASSDIISATVDFTAMRGLKFFAEVDFVESRSNDTLTSSIGASKAVGNNSGQFVGIGTKVSF